MKTNSKRISITFVFAALYAVGVIFLTPISFSVYQVRLADALLPLSMIFGIPGAIGFGLGALVSNFFGGLGMVDILGGAAANLIACGLGWFIARRNGATYRFLGSLIETVVITCIVGGYLSLLFGVPIEIGLFGVLIGSIIAINLIGFPIQEALRKNSVIKKFASE